jgi:hypothetical protein
MNVSVLSKSCLALVACIAVLLVAVSVPATDQELSNSVRELDRLMAELTVVQPQAEIELQYVEFDQLDIERLALEGAIGEEGLIELWEKDRARLLFAPKIVTQSGVEACMKSIREFIYPTEYVRHETTNKHTKRPEIAITIPTDWVTREVGTILVVLPEVSSDNRLLTIAMGPEIVNSVEWKKLTVGCGVDPNRMSVAEIPHFNTDSIETTITVGDGDRVLVGGGTALPGGEKIVYVFLIARLVGPDGVSVARTKGSGTDRQ